MNIVLLSEIKAHHKIPHNPKHSSSIFLFSINNFN